MRRLALGLWLVSGVTLSPVAASALGLGAREAITNTGSLQLGDAELGCAPDTSGVTHCTGGPAVDPTLPFRLDSWDIADSVSGSGARLDATFWITDLGSDKPNVASITLDDGSSSPLAPFGAPIQVTLSASLEVIDANGDGTASIQPFPASICGCDASGLTVLGGYSSTYLPLPIGLPAVSSPFGSASTDATLSTTLLDPEWFGLRLVFSGDVSPQDTAVVHLSLTAVPVPEPHSLPLAAGGLAALGVGPRSSRRRKPSG